MLYLVFNEGYTGDVDLAAEAIRLTRQVAAMTDDQETAGLLALMLLHHARRSARTKPDGSLIPLAEQDRSCWDTATDRGGGRDPAGERWRATGSVNSRPRPPSPPCTPTLPAPRRPTGCRSSGWYDELLRLTGSPVVALNRAVAVGEADGPGAGLAALAIVDPGLPRYTAASAYLHEKAGDCVTAARLYAEAARTAPNLAERHHLARQAARISNAARD